MALTVATNTGALMAQAAAPPVSWPDELQMVFDILQERAPSYQAKINRKICELGLPATEFVTFALSKAAEHAANSAGRRFHDGLEQEAANLRAARAAAAQAEGDLHLDDLE